MKYLLTNGSDQAQQVGRLAEITEICTLFFLYFFP